MKKVMVILIAVLTFLAIGLMIVSGCLLFSAPKEAPPEETQAGTLAILTESTETIEPTVSETTETETATHAETISNREEENKIKENAHFITVDRTVYLLEKASVRVGPDAGKPILCTLSAGDAVTQIGESDNGWSKIQCKGTIGYLRTSLLTTKNPSQKQPPQEETIDESAFRDVKDTVESTGSLHVRSGPGTDYKKIGYLKVGQQAQRVAVSDSGWSKIRYERGYGYVSSKYLKTVTKNPDNSSQEAPAYRVVDEVVYATASIHLRSGPGTDYKKIGYLQPGDSARRIAVGDNGWSRIRYQGGEAYASSKYLSVTVPDSSENGPAVQPEDTKPDPKPTEPDVHYQKVDETRVASLELTLRSGPGEHYTSLGTLSKGSLVHRIAISDNGWSVILLSGKQVFVESSLLEKEKIPEPKPTVPQETEKPEDGYEKVQETVITTDVLNVRSGPGTQYKKLGKLKKGTTIKRTAIGKDGWSRILYEGTEAYVNSSYIRKAENQPASPDSMADSEKPPKITYQKVDETVFAIDEVQVRVGPGPDFESIGSLFYGAPVKRVGIGSNGWSQILFEGEKAYACSRYLSTEEPEIPDFGDTSTPEFPTPNSPFIYQYWDEEGLLPYAVFVPAAADESSALPLIISLHGSSEVGKDRKFLDQHHMTKIFREWEYTELKPFDAYVVCPHLARDTGIRSWKSKEAADALFLLIEDLEKNYNIDKNQIILEGHSMGGQGALAIAADSRACFSRLAVISGYDPGVKLTDIQIPVRGYSGGAGPKDPRDDETSYHFMKETFTAAFGKESWSERPYSHDDVAMGILKEDLNQDGKSDLIQWMLEK